MGLAWRRLRAVTSGRVRSRRPDGVGNAPGKQVGQIRCRVLMRSWIGFADGLMGEVRDDLA